ncbi:MAG: rane bound O-acyl transferase family protein [Bacteroidota bacterium]|nr:rane bound O-acyl transferase family protein [Bacteroidota bacterium]
MTAVRKWTQNQGMLFNSLHFLFFFPIFCYIYFSVPKQHQYKILIAGGYYFYGNFSPFFAIILFVITCNDFFSAKMMEKESSQKRKKKWLYLSMLGNLGILFIFKYLDFADNNIRSFLSVLHIPWFVPEPWFNHWVVPVGLSFLTFQSLSYTIDVYKGVTKAEHHFGYFASFTAFWPVMVNGPIERAKNLLPQIKQEHHFDYDRMRHGLFRMAWGIFKKVVIADRLAFYANDMFSHYGEATGWTIWMGGFFFFLQVYCDFSGYSDIALGAAKVIGIDVMENFRRPFFSKNLAEFWTRWHISLSTWLTDYVFFYLGAYKATGAKVVFNVIFVLTLCGLWHGANWPMVLSFTMIGIFMSIRYLWQYNVVRYIKPSNTYKLFDKYFPGWGHASITVLIFVFCFILFRVHSIQVTVNRAHTESFISWTAIASVLYANLFKLNSAHYFKEWVMHKGILQFMIAVFFVLILFITEKYIGDHRIEDIVLTKPEQQRWLVYVLLFVSIIWFGIFNNTSFVYFQY